MQRTPFGRHRSWTLDPNTSHFMNNKIVGAILLVGAGLVAAVSTIGAQIANAMVSASVLSAYALGKTGGVNPPTPAEASPHWLIFVLVVLLTLSGLIFLFGRSKPE